MAKKNFIILQFILSLWVFLTPIKGWANDYTGVITTEIREPLILQERDEMNFGIIAPDPAGDQITLNTNNTIDTVNSSQSLGGQQFGRFRITGTPNSIVTYSFSSGDFLSGPGADMPFGNYTTNRPASFALNNNGRKQIRIGATLTVGPNQVAGTYSGSYTITVNYQ